MAFSPAVEIQSNRVNSFYWLYDLNGAKSQLKLLETFRIDSPDLADSEIPVCALSTIIQMMLLTIF